MPKQKRNNNLFNLTSFIKFFLFRVFFIIWYWFFIYNQLSIHRLLRRSISKTAHKST